MNLLHFVLFTVLAYLGISLMGQLASSTAPTPWQAALNLFYPTPLLVMLVANALWAVAAYYGLKDTKAAIPVLIALGFVVSYFYAVLFLGAEVNAKKLYGITVVLFGIWLTT